MDMQMTMERQFRVEAGRIGIGLIIIIGNRRKLP
jgi:hypothetical protein